MASQIWRGGVGSPANAMVKLLPYGSVAVTTAWSGAQDADIAVLVIDTKRGLDADTSAMLDRLTNIAPPKALDHDDFGSNRSEIINVIDYFKLERDAGGKPVPLFLIPL